jgi:hypothetical protein
MAPLRQTVNPHDHIGDDVTDHAAPNDPINSPTSGGSDFNAETLRKALDSETI